MVFPSCIQDIWINPNKQENIEETKEISIEETRNLEFSRKKKSEVINQFSLRNCFLIK